MLRPNTTRGGFTLLEVLVAVTILVMILSMIFGSFFYTVSTAERAEERAAMRHRAGFILEEISRTVSSAFVPYAGLYEALEGERTIFAGSANPLGEAQAGSLGVFTANPRLRSGAPGAGVAYVSYEAVEAFEIEDAFEWGLEWVRDENNPLVLMCTVEPMFAIADSESGRFRFWTLNVRSIGFQYFDGNGWLDEWVYEEQGALPGAVKIEVEFGDSDGESHAYSTIARIHTDTLLEEPIGIFEPEEEIEEDPEEELGEDPEVEFDEDPNDGDFPDDDWGVGGDWGGEGDWGGL
jgi:general secretion pathway protein J